MNCSTCGEKILLNQLYSEYDYRPFCSDECIVIKLRHDGEVVDLKRKGEKENAEDLSHSE